MFFDSWQSLFRIVVTRVLAYVGTTILMRVSSNRTLSKMNSFDLVVTIAFGSTPATLLIHDGRFLHHPMKQVRVTEDEIRAVVPKNGVGSMETIAAVMMESDGSPSVIASEAKGQSDNLRGVYRYESDETSGLQRID